MAEMSRIGTNDLSDVLHDLDAWGYLLLSKQFLDELVELHGLGWVHRDIKPGNIMLPCKKMAARLMQVSLILVSP